MNTKATPLFNDQEFVVCLRRGRSNFGKPIASKRLAVVFDDMPFDANTHFEAYLLGCAAKCFANEREDCVTSVERNAIGLDLLTAFSAVNGGDR